MVCLLALPGVLFSVFLTVVKFRSAYRCDFNWFSACSGKFSECAEILTSSVSMIGPLPISAFSTAVFAVMLGLAIATLRQPSKMAPETRPLLLALASISLAIVVLLGGYATFVFRGYCSYCVIIYAITATLFLSVSLLHPQGLRSGYRALFSKQTLRSSTLLLSLLSLMAMLSVQLWLYRTGATEISFADECIVSGSRLPDTNIRLGPDKPTVDVALFLDPACNHCKDEFEFYYNAVTEQRVKGLRLSVFHLPRVGECLPENYRSSERQASFAEGACDASIAVECVETIAPGKGIEMLREAFKLQASKSSPWFNLEDLDAAATKIGVESSIQDCIRSPPNHDIFHEHARFALGEDLLPPSALFIFFDDDGRPLPRLILDQGKKDRPLKATLAEAERRARERPEPKKTVE